MYKPKRLQGIRKIFSKNHSFINTIKAATNPNSIIIHWPSKGKAKDNFGDKLNPYIAKKISNKEVFNSPEVLNLALREEYKVIGSSLGNKLDERVTVWGTGFISYDKKPKVAPRKICAVRGPLSRKKFLDANISCPEVYGDPALLLPKYLKVQKEKRYPLGFIAQWRDTNEPLVREIMDLDFVKVIDITDTIENFVQQVNSCDKIITSTLHALITCDAYEVPSLWLRVSDEPLGDWFKFQDYYASIGYFNAEPATISSVDEFKKLERKCTVHDLNIDLEKLIYACPFK